MKKYNGPMRFEVDLYPNFIEQRTRIVPQNIFEIGSNTGFDADYLRKAFNVPESNTFCFEANPFTFEILQKEHPNFNNFNVAVSNFTGTEIFKCSRSENQSSSFNKKRSIPSQDYIDVEVSVYTMEHIINHYDIKNIDICKVDVEGFTLEVLEGFGDKISIVKSFQLEDERFPVFGDNQKLFPDTCNFLSSKGFTLLTFIDWGAQCDTIWVRNDMLSYETFNYGCDFYQKS
jgi:FkbM family methyltransferase